MPRVHINSSDRSSTLPPKIPRPPNAFILYRSDKIPSLPPPPVGVTRNQQEVSKLIGEMWRRESPSVRAEFEARAERKKREHEIQYPGYKYSPQTRDRGSRETEKNKKEMSNKIGNGRGIQRERALLDGQQTKDRDSRDTETHKKEVSNKIGNGSGTQRERALLKGQQLSNLANCTPSSSSSSSSTPAGPSFAKSGPSFGYYPPYRFAGSIRFDDMGAYQVDEAMSYWQPQNLQTRDLERFPNVAAWDDMMGLVRQG